MNYKLTIDSLLIIDDNGMPKPPTLRQLIDRDIRELFTRDKTPDKVKAIAECGVIYQCGDPKSHAKQQGLSNDERIHLRNTAIKLYQIIYEKDENNSIYNCSLSHYYQ